MSTAIAKRDQMKAALEMKMPDLQNALPASVDKQRYASQIMFAILRNPKIVECTTASVLESVMTAAQLGLDLTPTQNGAHLIPYGKTCQLIPGYRGLIDIARRSGQVTRIEAHVVREGDEFKVVRGCKQELIHEPKFLSQKPVCVWALAALSNGEFIFEVMMTEEINAIRKESRSGNSDAWKKYPGEMARKTVVRRLCKWLPATPELEAAMALENMAEGGGAVGNDFVDAECEEAPKAPEPIQKESAYEEAVALTSKIGVDDAMEIAGACGFGSLEEVTPSSDGGMLNAFVCAMRAAAGEQA